jgi:uncharacterized membrane protein
MNIERMKRGVAASMAGLLLVGAAGAVVHAAAPTSETLVYAVYDGENTAGNVFKTMQSAQWSTGERIEAYAIVSKDLKGKVRVRDQRKTDAGVGAAVGALIGVLGGPIGVAFGATTGGAVGYLTGDSVGIPKDRIDNMKQSLTPNSSALVVVLNDRWVNDVQRDMDQAHARAVIANKIAQPNGTN